MMRLQKYLALSGVASRRASEKLIAEGHVTVNGHVVTEMGVQVDEFHDKIAVDGVICQLEEEKHYLAYNKPIGEVTTVTDPEGRATVMDKFRDYPVRLYPVGRLDYDSEGLILLTNDGDLMNNLLHPSREVNKEYLVFICDENDRVVGFGLCFPAIGDALKKSGGRLTPMALFRLLCAVKRPKTIDLALVAVRPAYQNAGINAILLDGILDMLEKGGVQTCETNLNLETNTAVQAQWKYFFARQHKRRRAYSKKIGD